MTAQGKHRAQPHTVPVPFTPLTHDQLHTIQLACYRLQAKGYEVRAMRLHLDNHGKKLAVVIHMSPAPGIGPRKQPELVGTGVDWRGTPAKYHNQNVGTTRRRNIETLLAYVEGLPDVRQADADVAAASGGEDVHQGTAK